MLSLSGIMYSPENSLTAGLEKPAVVSAGWWLAVASHSADIGTYGSNSDEDHTRCRSKHVGTGVSSYRDVRFVLLWSFYVKSQKSALTLDDGG